MNCAIGSIYPVFAFFFASYQESERADDEDTISFVLPPTPAKTARERLMTELEVGIWHDVGTTTSNGQTHAVRFFHGGDYYRLRARYVLFPGRFIVIEISQLLTGSIASNPNATIVSRSNEGRDGGFVADFYWSDNNQGAYNSFHSSSASTSFFAANAAGWMVNNAHAIAACAVFTDDDGVLDVGGVLSLGWNGQPFEFADGQLGAYYGLCTSNPQV